MLHGKLKSLGGQEVDLTQYHGKVLLIVNGCQRVWIHAAIQGLTGLIR